MFRGYDAKRPGKSNETPKTDAFHEIAKKHGLPVEMRVLEGALEDYMGLPIIEERKTWPASRTRTDKYYEWKRRWKRNRDSPTGTEKTRIQLHNHLHSIYAAEDADRVECQKTFINDGKGNSQPPIRIFRTTDDHSGCIDKETMDKISEAASFDAVDWFKKAADDPKILFIDELNAVDMKPAFDLVKNTNLLKDKGPKIIITDGMSPEGLRRPQECGDSFEDEHDAMSSFFMTRAGEWKGYADD